MQTSQKQRYRQRFYGSGATGNPTRDESIARMHAAEHIEDPFGEDPFVEVHSQMLDVDECLSTVTESFASFNFNKYRDQSNVESDSDSEW